MHVILQRGMVSDCLAGPESGVMCGGCAESTESSQGIMSDCLAGPESGVVCGGCAESTESRQGVVLVCGLAWSLRGWGNELTGAIIIIRAAKEKTVTLSYSAGLLCFSLSNITSGDP
ncbi:hypothetical protein RRG08_026359 [Elysia crispata]|uniref:Uncharacterized protein n=1 Tax=Elysia crispata TaxID=231223 RepID=A0AAE0XMZ1_9GAST|nr:hypothetical protein RRG08_026359 [Elysia crispata]